MGVEFMPATIAPEGFQAQEGFIPCRGPELAGAFEAALVLPAGGLNGTRTQRLVGEFELLRRGGAGHNGLSGGDDFLVFHPVSIMLKVFNLGLEFLLLGLQETGFEFGQVGDEGGGLIVANLLEQRLYPSAGFGCAPSVEIVSHRPEMFFGARGPTVDGLWTKINIEF